ncbi:Glutathione S-transferase lancl1 [Dermatophagoides farinae]|uniref:Glutathione S-transferase lancl1 n=1 Tax=Dermatophagoides farinae TaxID=6954 RepID=A0A922L2X2_DERFA|nr:lanC-like protein 2 [Dermatophagoides farinae]KAH7646153.1 lanc-like protein 2-like protein [Dermatophagoides farinae]KAH9516508.1 Glutathione S-transferase lancl1 [Dermatophagoides farinae]
MGERYFPNHYLDYNDDNETLLIDGSESLITSLCTDFLRHIRVFLQELESNLTLSSSKDFTIYTGSTGIVLLYLKLYELNAFENERQDILRKANSLIKRSLENIGGGKERYSFLCGQTGVLACKVLINHARGKDYSKYLRIIRNLAPKILSDSTELPDEILFGRSGFLYSLLMIREKIEDSVQILDDNLIRSLVEKILKSGQLTSQREKNSSIPLIYYWHEKAYVGAAHGYAGILYILLEARNYLDDEKELNTLIKPTIDFVLGLQFPDTGNYRSSLNNTEDRLVHWCHGSPGVIHLLSLAYQVFEKEIYLNAAIKAADDIWHRGLLKKGCGLCHGTAGNGYAFIRLFQLTNDQKYLYRAVKFAEWCFEPHQHRIRIADRPYSLFEGLAGTIYFLADIIHPKQARFPAFQIKF